MTKNLYNENSIVTETPREFTRRVPSTYLGSSKTNTNLIKEVFANAVDEHAIGHGNQIDIKIDTEKNIYSVEDHGQGFLINAGIDDDGETILQRSFDKLNTSGKTSEEGVYNGTALGLNGIGAKLTNWLSSELHVITYRDGESEALWFKDGIFKKREVKKVKHDSGTIVTWKPDPQFFAENTPDINALKSHFEIIAALCPELTIKFNYNGEDNSYFEPGGINAYVEKKVKGKELFSNRFIMDRTIGKDKLNICITYTSDYSENIDAYVNLGHTDSGSHIGAFHTAFVKAVNKYATDVGLLKKNDRNFNNAEISEGLYVVFNMTTTTAKYDAQNKSRIDDIDAKIINAVVGGDFATWLINNPSDAKIIVERALQARKAREAAQKAKEKIRDAGKKVKSIFIDLPSKLSDAYPKNKKDRSNCELYICEGDSAGSSINATKDSTFQACFPIRGKILCCQKATPDKVFSNVEIANITKALGLDVDKTTGKLIYDSKKLRYSRIIIACFTGDTKVKSLDGKSYSFKELVDNNINDLWVYSMNNHGNIVPGHARDIRIVNTTNELIELTLDNDEVITCTPDHYIMNAEGKYIMAKDLNVDDSLMPLYTQKSEDGHIEYFDKNSGKYKMVHQMVAENVLIDEMNDAQNRLSKEEHNKYQNNIVVHHKNILDPNNKTNNTPSNLMWLTNKEHFSKHSQSGYTAYNVSDKHKTRISELHSQGVYEKTYWSNNGYNNSEKHKQDIRNAAKRGAYDNAWDAYNQSQKHSEVVAKTNKSEKHILSVKRSSVGKSVRFLLENNLPFDENTYNFYRVRRAAKYSDLLSLFDSYEDIISYATDKQFDLSNYKLSHDFEDFNEIEYNKNRIASVIKKLINRGLEFNKDNYDSFVKELNSKGYKINPAPYQFITKFFDSYELAYEAGMKYNHSIKAIRHITVDNEPVYCMNVDDYHNFALDSGVFVKNCDEDIDGSDIALLLLTVFNWLCPELIINGHIYRVHSALFKVTFKDGTYKTFQTDTELEAWKKTNKKPYKLSRAKGLGELTNEETYEQIINPETRDLVQLVTDDMVEFNKYLEIFKGIDVAPRREYLEEHFNDYDE